MSTLRVDNLQGQTADGVDKYIVQVKSKMITNTVTHDQTSVKNITLLDVDITPKSVNNKMLVTACIGSCGRDGNGDLVFNIVRDSTSIAVGDTGTYKSSFVVRASSEVSGGISFTCLDSPATTSSVNYKLTVQQTGAGNLKINGRQPDTTFATPSTITVQEIAQ
tara:strand:- start:882 stop:1373 length:492 start_codon:yes stop_codon:yes gene_type:complete